MILTGVNMAKQASSIAHRVVYFTIESPKAAKRLIDKLVTSPNDKLILPFIDHPGPVTDELLSRKLQSMTFCDRDDKKRQLFQRYITDNFPNQDIQLFSEDLFDLSFKDWSDKAQRRCSEIVSKSLVNPEETADNHHRYHHCDTNIKFLVPLLRSRNEGSFLKNIYLQYAMRIGLCAQTYIHYYFLVSDRQYAYLVAQPSSNLNAYRSSTILYNTIFNIRTLDSFDLKEAFQIPLKELQKTAQANSSAYQKVHMVSLEPNLQFLQSMDSKSLLEYRFFINQMMMKRTCSVTTFLDRWFDNFSEIVTQLGIDERTRAGDLNKNQYLQLFIYFKNRPKYRESTFLEAVATLEESL